MSSQRNILVLLTALTLASCGFRPVYKDYGTDKTLSTELASIKVEGLREDRHAQVLSSELSDLLDPTNMDVPQQYTLALTPVRRRDASAIQRNREITRYNVSVTTKYELKETATGKIVKRGASTMNGSYDTLGSDFANWTAEEDAVRKIMKEIAKDIRFQLTSQFLDKAASTKKK